MEILKHRLVGMGVVLVCAGFMNSCSSGKSNVTDLDELAADSERYVNEKVSEEAQETGMVAAVSAGAPVLNFFRSMPTYGVVLNDFRWNQPLGSSNPGMDCRLQLRKMGPPHNVFSCLVKTKNESPVVVTVMETFGVQRKLVRVIVDSKGNGSRAHWEQDLRRAGYTPVNGARPTYRSRDGATLAEFIWVPQKEALSLVFKPAL